MPMLISLGMHPAPMAAQERLRPGERIFAFLDDVCIVCHPELVETVDNIAAELWAHAQIQVHEGKTQVWNRAGKELAGMHELTIKARRIDPDAVVWKGDAGLDPSQRGIKVLGSPIERRVREDPVARPFWFSKKVNVTLSSNWSRPYQG